MIADFETRTGRALHPAQPERLMIDMYAYRELLVRQDYQAAAVRMLLAHADDMTISFLGELVGAARIPPAAATCPIQITAQAAHPGFVVPAGWGVQSKDGRFVFALDEDLVVPAGALTASAPATCTEEGPAANGFLPGAVLTILEPLPFVTAATNTQTTGGGADEEDLEHYRERIRLAPSQYSTGGSTESYRFHALGASSEVVSVAIANEPGAGIVNIYPLTKTGAPSGAVLAAVLAACSAEKVRPITDHVNVIAPTAKPFAVNANITLYDTADPEVTLAASKAAGEAYVNAIRLLLGRDPVDSQIIRAMQVEGVYRVELVGWAALAVNTFEYADCTGVTVNPAGVVNG